mmetsp:Transcript_25710/g.42241  ORF Transcript_25710/g.42241 Transcript_25710/m.42241 type:complete len:394 (-) Transcript_25710:403-1584(-)
MSQKTNSSLAFSLQVSQYSHERLGRKSEHVTRAKSCSLLLRSARKPRNGRRACFIVASGSPSTAVDIESDFVQLGSSAVSVSRIGVGTIAWGDPSWSFGVEFAEEDLRQSFNILLAGGINFFDTAEVYGYKNLQQLAGSEQLLGRCMKRSPMQRETVVATKFMPIPWTNLLVGGGFRLGRKNVLEALKASLTRLDVPRVDLYQIHFPFPTYSIDSLMAALADAVEQDLTRAVGVSNYNADQMTRAQVALSSYGIPLASNQVSYSVLDRRAEKSGLLKTAQDLNVSVIAYSPLAQGLLSGKYTGKEALPSSRFKPAEIEKVTPLVNLLKFIGVITGGRSAAQVALNYLVCKGAIPICGCKTVDQAADIVGALSWRLTPELVATIDEKADYIASH